MQDEVKLTQGLIIYLGAILLKVIVVTDTHYVFKWVDCDRTWEMSIKYFTETFKFSEQDGGFVCR